MAIPDNISKLTPQEWAALRTRARTDKLFLATEVLGYDFVPEVHKELFDQFIAFDKSKAWAEQSSKAKRLILWSRGHFKSSAVVVDAVQAILCFPDIRILLMQGTLKTTRRLLREIASHFSGDARNSRLLDLFPEVCAPPPEENEGKRKKTNPKRILQLTADAFTVSNRVRKQLQQPTVSCASPKATKTGQHYDIAYFDDLVNDQNYRSAHLLEKVREDYYMCLPLLDPPFYAIVTGTRYAHEDLYATLMKNDVGKDEWLVSVKTCWTDDGQQVRFPQQKTKDGRFVGFTREMLDNICEADPAMFASQYLNKPASSATQQFDKTQLEARLIAPALAPALNQPWMFVDLAMGADERSDDSVILLASTDHLGKIYITHGRGGKWDTAQTALQIIDFAVRHRPVMVFLERSAAGIAFMEYLRMVATTRGIFLPLDFLKADNKPDAKYIRVSALSGYFRQNRLFFFLGLECWPKLLHQFETWSGEKGRHDDYPDTVAIAAQYFAHSTPLVSPLSAEKFPFLKIMELGTDISREITAPSNPAEMENSMGDDFCY